MSEYQRYEFLAIDRRLSEEDMDALREFSTRATITPTRFFNEYHWGDFKGDPDDLMDLYFDAYAYWSNWGSRELQLKIPGSAIDDATLAPYRVEGGLEWRRVESFLIVKFRLDHEPEDGWIEDKDFLYTLSTLRNDLMSGDLRPLYVAWLACTLGYSLEDDAIEPPVPPGLASLTPALQELAGFFDVWPGLLAVGAERSAPSDDTMPTKEQLAAWLSRWPEGEKTATLVRLVADDDRTLRSELLRRFRNEVQSAPASAAPARTAEALREAALRREKAEQERAEREAILAHQRALDELATRREEVWLEVMALIGEKKVSAYDQAVPLLKDLMELAEREGERAAAQARLETVLAKVTRRPALLDRLRAAGLM